MSTSLSLIENLRYGCYATRAEAPKHHSRGFAIIPVGPLCTSQHCLVASLDLAHASISPVDQVRVATFSELNSEVIFYPTIVPAASPWCMPCLVDLHDMLPSGECGSSVDLVGVLQSHVDGEGRGVEELLQFGAEVRDLELGDWTVFLGGLEDDEYISEENPILGAGVFTLLPLFELCGRMTSIREARQFVSAGH